MTTPPLRIAALVSGGGRTVANLAEAIKRDGIRASIELVVAHRADLPAVERCRGLGLDVVVVPPAPEATLADRIDELLVARSIDLVCLCGYLRRFRVGARWAGRAINIHPSLLPAFGGHGMYGLRVHEAVIAAGATTTGCTVHLVDEDYDRGRILLQRSIEVPKDATPERLADLVFAEECIALPEAVRAMASCNGPVRRDGTS
jgi:folate-dependent phosphoribosylglycinamide formyltransferase PurN